MTGEIKKTPLYEEHKKLGARMVNFVGWEMPIQYSSIIQEHLKTRQFAGLFDVSHMGEIFLEGEPDSLLRFLESMTCNLVQSLKPNQVQYNAIVNEKGGVVDDITLYKFSESKYMICSNAANYETVFEHLQSYKDSSKFEIRNESLNWNQIAIQGPASLKILESYLKQEISSIRYYRFAEIQFEGEKLLLSRTGYTGEDGFEIYSSPTLGIKIWLDLLTQNPELSPVGLGARDTLRLEAKYPLYGHELNSERTPVESGIGWIVKEKPVPFLGRDKILKHKKEGTEYGICGVILEDYGVPRENYKVYSVNHHEIGYLTSGTYSPSLKKGIALAFIKKEYHKDGQEIFIDIRNEKKKAKVHLAPFIKTSIVK